MNDAQRLATKLIERLRKRAMDYRTGGKKAHRPGPSEQDHTIGRVLDEVADCIEEALLP